MQCYLCNSEEQPHMPRPAPRKLAQVVPGPGFRMCSKSGCREPAECSLAHSYAEQRVWLLELEPAPDPHVYDLCTYHADRFRPPRGWSAEDLRAGSGRLV